MKPRVDTLVVGAGFSGLVLAERLASELGQECLVVDRREHIGGNAYDTVDDAGVLIHPYGPHYFRTNSEEVVDYLSRFTEWQDADYRILSCAGGRLWSFPVNLETYEQLVGRPATESEFREYLERVRIPCDSPANSEEVMLSKVGRELYEKFFLGYTLKHWRRHPRELDPSVCARIPVRTTRDGRYLDEAFQKLPKEGYTRMFERMIGASPRIKVETGVDFRTIRDRIRCRHLVFTGPIDEFFDRCHGRLAYRSLRFEHESFDARRLEERVRVSGKPGFWQPAVQVNYPGDEPFTRIVELKHVTGQQTPNTTIIREFPRDDEPGSEPYYPVPSPETRAAYRKYRLLAEAEKHVSFVGRLATYRYYNMDQVVSAALAEFRRLAALENGAIAS